VPNPKLLIFAKYPAPGAVMTRLCPPLTPEEAAAVQRACIRVLCERAFRSWPVRPVLVISPDDAEERFREFVGPYVPIMPQGTGDLGERLTRAAQSALADGSPEVLIIGADSPTIRADVLTAASEKLEKADVVIGPCDDGGFYLIGLKRVEDGMFADIDWGTQRVMAQTTRRIKARGMSLAKLGPWYDIDRPADLERAVRDIRSAQQPDDYELRRVLETVLEQANERQAEAVQ